MRFHSNPGGTHERFGFASEESSEEQSAILAAEKTTELCECGGSEEHSDSDLNGPCVLLLFTLRGSGI